MDYLVREYAVNVSLASTKQIFWTNAVDLAGIAQHTLRTAWAFTHSDFKTIVIPVVCGLQNAVLNYLAKPQRRMSTR